MLSFLLEAADSSFVRLFTEMNEWTIILFVLGLIFCCIEMFIPGFGWFGGVGIGLIVIGIILRMIGGGDIYMLLYMVLIALALFILMFFVLSRLINKGRVSKSAVFNVGTAVPEDKTEGTKDFSHLVGKCGVVLTVLRPIGKADFEGELVDVVSRDGYIGAGETVEVLSVEGQRVVVAKK